MAQKAPEQHIDFQADTGGPLIVTVDPPADTGGPSVTQKTLRRIHGALLQTQETLWPTQEALWLTQEVAW